MLAAECHLRATQQPQLRALIGLSTAGVHAPTKRHMIYVASAVVSRGGGAP